MNPKCHLLTFLFTIWPPLGSPQFSFTFQILIDFIIATWEVVIELLTEGCHKLILVIFISVTLQKVLNIITRFSLCIQKSWCSTYVSFGCDWTCLGLCKSPKRVKTGRFVPFLNSLWFGDLEAPNDCSHFYYAVTYLLSFWKKCTLDLCMKLFLSNRKRLTSYTIEKPIKFFICSDIFRGFSGILFPAK